MKKHLITVFLICASGSLSSCKNNDQEDIAQLEERKMDFETIGDRLALLNYEDGIDQFEAESLAMAYYLHFEGRGGGVYGAYEKNGTWVVETIHRDYVPKDITIDMVTGRISHEEHPALEYPWKALYEHLEFWSESQTDLTK